MKTSHLTVLLPTCLAVVGVAFLVFWTSAASSNRFDVRSPGQDGTPQATTGGVQRELKAGDPVAGPGNAADIPGVWPGFRGPKHDAICGDGVPLARQWGEAGPPILWEIPVGEGYAGAAIRDGRVYLLDVNSPGGGEPSTADVIRCLSLADGREIWRNSYPAEVAPNHGMSRTVPVIADDSVITIGPRCHVACWDAETGENRWLLDMVQRFGARERQWYTGQCPLIDDGRLILAPGGPEVLVVALDIRTGEEIWRTSNPRGWQMSHASILPMEFAGRKLLVYCGTGGTVGVDASDGTILWDETTWTEHFATSPSPLPLPDGQIFLCSGYDSIGARMLQLQNERGTIRCETAFDLDRKQFNSEQQTPIFYQGYLYGVRKHRGGQLVCLDLQGNEVWNSGQDRFGHGPYMIADGMLLALEDEGLLIAAEATHEVYRPLGRVHVFDGGNEAWGPMALAGGHLVVRDMSRMACLDLRKK